jgi:hypothetical protein
MESAVRDHPLWAGAKEEEIDSALEVNDVPVLSPVKLYSVCYIVC